MARQPPFFEDKDSLVDALSKNKSKIEKAFHEQTLEEIVRRSVGPNTFRAFHKVPQPSKVFQKWATERLRDRRTIRSLAAVQSQASYDKWLEGISSDLAAAWHNQTGHVLKYGACRKLTNLLLKGFARWQNNGLSDKQRERLISFLHVALDSYALRAIKPAAAHLGIPIPSNPTMKSVKDKPYYDRLQRAIREIAVQAGVPPIYFDVLVWDKNADKL